MEVCMKEGIFVQGRILAKSRKQAEVKVQELWGKGEAMIKEVVLPGWWEFIIEVEEEYE